MNRFWKRETGLERRLKAERPGPSRSFMSSMMERLDTVDPPRTRRSVGLRVSLASAVSLAFLTSLAAFGGLGYAANSIAQVGRTASHVVVPQHRGVPAATQGNAANANASSSRGNNSSSNENKAEGNSSSRGVSSADDQYNNEIVCLLIFPGTKYAHILKLPRFLVPFYLAFNPNAEVVTCPTRRGH
jgi:hypothetical protein